MLPKLARTLKNNVYKSIQLQIVPHQVQLLASISEELILPFRDKQSTIEEMIYFPGPHYRRVSQKIYIPVKALI
jgi:hypothetical protein